MTPLAETGLEEFNYPAQIELSPDAVRNRVSRRKILAGFPVGTPFQSLEEVRNYLAGDRVVCLLCGKTYEHLGNHVTRIHNVTPDQYREKYNIPWTYGLVGKSTSDAYSVATIKRIASGWMPPVKTGNAHAKMIRQPHRKELFKSEIAKGNLNQFRNSKFKRAVS